MRSVANVEGTVPVADTTQRTAVHVQVRLTTRGDNPQGTGPPHDDTAPAPTPDVQLVPAPNPAEGEQRLLPRGGGVQPA